MTQPDPNVESTLTGAVPILSYERQSDHNAAAWVVRFTGAWLICRAAASLLYHVVRLFEQGWGRLLGAPWLDWIDIFNCAATIACGIAIVQRQRYGFHGKLTLLLALPIIYLEVEPARDTLSWLGTAPVGILQTAAVFAMLLSILRHADAHGALCPARPDHPPIPAGNSFRFLLSRIGWIYLAQGGAALPLLALVLWNSILVASRPLQAVVDVAIQLAVAVCGLCLCWRKPWALWLLAALVPMQTAAGIWAMMQYFVSFSRTPDVVSSIAEALTTTLLLCLLAAKATRER